MARSSSTTAASWEELLVAEDRGVTNADRVSPRLEAWVRETFPSEHVKTVAYTPYLTFFYPQLRKPTRFDEEPRQTVVRPADTAEVAAILQRANELAEPVFVR